MAFNVFFRTVENHKELRIKGVVWRCEKCHCDDDIMTKITIDYDSVVLCKKCLLDAKRLITDMEKEKKHGKDRKNTGNDKARRSNKGTNRKGHKQD